MNAAVIHSLPPIDSRGTATGVRVVHTVGSLKTSHGGPSRSVVFLCEALARQGVEVEIVAGAPVSGETTIAPSAAVRVRLVEAPPAAALLPGRGSAFQSEVADAARGGAVVHDHGMWLPSNVASMRAARAAGAPLVVSTKGMASEWALRHRRLRKSAAWWLYQRSALKGAALLQATSESEAADVHALRLGLPVALVRHGVDAPPAAPRAKAGGPRTALFLSRFHPVKGLPMLVEAWARVRPDGWTLVLAGPDDGGHRAEIERLVAEHGLTSAVRFVEPVAGDAKWDLLRSADLFVLPTYSENFGIAVAEALAVGVPVITTTGAPWSVLESERCGWWTDVSVGGLAGALSEATSRPAACLREMGERGRRYAEENLRWDRVASDMLAAYRWLLGDGPQPACVDTSQARSPRPVTKR